MAAGSVGGRASVTIEGVKMGGKPRAYALSEIASGAMRDYLRETAAAGRSQELEHALFLGVRRGAPWSYSGVRKLLERVNREAGLSTRISCYSFRRNAATSLFLRGMRLERISKFLGHTRTATTMRYIQNLPEINAEASRMLAEEYCGIA